MGQFNNKIMAEFNPPRKWTLGRALSYTTNELTVDEIKALKGVGVKVKRETNKTETITVPNGFVTDLASVPRAMWWLIAPFDVARAAIIHDLLFHLMDPRTEGLVIADAQRIFSEDPRVVPLEVNVDVDPEQHQIRLVATLQMVEIDMDINFQAVFEARG